MVYARSSAFGGLWVSSDRTGRPFVGLKSTGYRVGVKKAPMRRLVDGFYGYDGRVVINQSIFGDVDEYSY